MASEARLRIILEAQGIKPTTKNLRILNATLKKSKEQAQGYSKAANKVKRVNEAVGKTSLSAGKAFSRQASGMGGLVAAYATIAANVFALSAAFLLLRRAADLSSMQKSAQNFSDRFGVSIARITKRMQEASGGALDFAEALPSINKAVSAGVGIEQIEQLTVAATKASQTFGGSTTEALNRFISASQRGRVEIIQTLGVVIKTEQAYKSYAATIGKTSLELSAYDRQQAILNATIEASQKVFAGIVIDANPFTQFASTMVDVKNEMLTFITDGLTPFLESFNKSKNAAIALIAVMAAIVAKKIFPQLTAGLASFSKASIASNIKAAAAFQKANAKKLARQVAFAKTSGRKSKKQLIKIQKAEEASYAKRENQHESFKKSIFKADGSIDAKRLNQQKAALIKQEKILTKGGTKGTTDKLSKDVVVLRKKIDNTVRLIAVTTKLNNSEKAMGATLDRTRKAFGRTTAAIGAATAATRSFVVGLSSGVITGFSKGFNTMQNNVGLALKKTGLAWTSFQNSIGKEGVNSLKRFSEAAGRSFAVVAGGITRLIGLGTSLLVAYSLFNLFWETFGDRIKGITEEQRELLDSFQDLGDSFKEVTASSKKYLANMQGGVLTLSTFISEAEFLRGTFDSLTVAVGDFNSALFNTLGSQSIEDLSTYFDRAAETAKNFQKDIDAAGTLGGGTSISQTESFAQFGTDHLSLADPDTINALEVLNKNTRGFKMALKELNEQQLDSVIGNLATMKSLLEQTGFGALNAKLTSGIVVNLKKIAGEGERLATIFEFGTLLEFKAAVDELNKVDPGKAAAAVKAAGDAYQIMGKEGKSVTGNFVSSGRALEEINKNMEIYVSGLEKAKAASVPNKAIFNILLDSERALKDLTNTAKGSGTKQKLEDLIGAPDLKSLRDFLALSDDITFAKTLKIVQKELKIYDAIIEDTINNTSLFKRIQNEVFRLKNEEVSTDARRLEVLKELNELGIDKATLDRETARHKLLAAQSEVLRLQRLKLLNKEVGEHALAGAHALVRSLASEVIGHQQVINSIRAKLNVERELQKQRERTLASETKINNLKQSILKEELKNSANQRQHLSIAKSIYESEKLAFKLRLNKLELEKEGLSFDQKSIEANAERLLQIQQEKNLIDAQTESLRIQKELRLEAETAEQNGVSIFDPEGMKIAAELLAQRIRDAARYLKSTFEIISEGFEKNINGAFDTAVDNLLEGGKDFGKTVREAIKEGLRATFGEAIKARIQETIGEIFGLKKANPVEKNTIAVENLTAAMIAANPTATVMPSIFNNTPEKDDSTLGLMQSLLSSELQNMLSLSATMATTATTEHVQKLTAEQLNTNAITANTAAILAKTANMVGPAGTPKTPFGAPGNKPTPVSSELAGIPNALEKLLNSGLTTTNPASDEIANKGVETAIEGIASQKEGSTGVKNILLSVIQAIISSGSTASIFGNAVGGIIPGGTGITPMASGGIATGPNLALIGEGKNNEAVVPLPNNREIPVDLKNNKDGDTINIEQSFDFRNAGPDTVVALRTEARAIEERTFNRVFSEINKGGKYAKIVGRR